jgi:alpha-beta hydrolase superfamily lysophospholipase
VDDDEDRSTSQPPDPGPAAPCLLHRVREERVEQAIDGERRGTFQKEILRAELASGRNLALVRKRSSESPSHGAVVLIHGFAQNRYSWHLDQRSLVNFLAEQGLDTYNLELAGHGRSREFGTAPPLAFSDYIDDCTEVVKAVAAYSGQGKVFVMGHSMGGAVCYAIAPLCTEHIAGVITLGGIYYFGRNPVLSQIARLLTVVDRRSSRLRRLGIGFNTKILGQGLIKLLPLADKLSWSLPIAGWVPGSTERSIISERVLKGFDWTGLGVCMQMMGWAVNGRFDGEDGTDYKARFAALDIPLLVVAGNEDRLATPADVRPAWEDSQSSDKTYREFSPVKDEIHWGHLCIVLGAKASTYVWPFLAEWMLERCDRTTV